MNLYNYEDAIQWLQKRGKELYGSHFKIIEEDKENITKLLCYFLKDKHNASRLGINLQKGILLTGPIGVGKSSLMNLMRFYEPAQTRFIFKSCRDISFEFIKDGYDTIHKYSNRSFKTTNQLFTVLMIWAQKTTSNFSAMNVTLWQKFYSHVTIYSFLVNS